MTATTAAPELNWSGTYRYRADQVHRPRTVAELQAYEKARDEIRQVLEIAEARWTEGKIEGEIKGKIEGKI